MKINLDQKIKLLEHTILRNPQTGEIIEERDYFNDGNDRDLLLAQVCARGLINAPPPRGKEISAEDKIKRFRLATALIDGGEQDISVDDLKLIQDCVNGHYGTIAIVAQAHAMLEGD